VSQLDHKLNKYSPSPRGNRETKLKHSEERKKQGNKSPEYNLYSDDEIGDSSNGSILKEGGSPSDDGRGTQAASKSNVTSLATLTQSVQPLSRADPEKKLVQNGG
tara:strand:- start:413 stop:727 length:315 start_codon:yes stop_codon:yes gene_type:complete